MPNARAHVVQVLCEWGKSHRYAADLIEERAVKAALSSADRGLLLDVTLTTLRHLMLLDHWIQALTGDRELDVRTRWLLRAGLAELLLLDMAEHATVNETVALAGRASGLVNAVLRRACREKGALRREVETLPATIRFSHPAFLLKRWAQQFGEAGAERLAGWNQEPAPVYVRMNGLHPEAAQRLRDLPGLEPVGGGFFRCELLPREALAAGWCYAQDPSTAVAPELLGAEPGMTVLDACAAPGGKAALLAQAMQNQGRLVVCDLPGGRLERLEQNLRRLGVRCAEVVPLDWAATGGADLPLPEGSFDRILIDAPCSNTGVMRRRVDVRWRLKESELERLVDVQRVLLARCAPLLKPGGRLVYSTCSVERAENQDQVAWVREHVLELRWLRSEARLPQQHGVDGAFAALFEKA